MVTIFPYAANEDDADADGLLGDPNLDLGADTPVNKHSRDKLEEFIGDYNSMHERRNGPGSRFSDARHLSVLR